MKIVPILLTSIQMLSLIIMILLFEFTQSSLLVMSIQAVGLIVGAMGILIMFRYSKLSPFPVPEQNAKLITSGIYKFIRHPMYLALFMIFTPIAIDDLSLAGMAIYLVFVVNQFAKLFYEEKLLRSHFPDYESYMKRSWRLIPFVF